MNDDDLIVTDEEREAVTLFDDHEFTSEPDWQSLDVPEDDEGETALNEKTAPVVFTTAHEAVMQDLEPILRELRDALKADDAEFIAKLKAINISDLANRVLRSGNLEAELLGIMGQEFANAVHLPQLINNVLSDQKEQP